LAFGLDWGLLAVSCCSQHGTIWQNWSPVDGLLFPE